jgi:hypothetical protein
MKYAYIENNIVKEVVQSNPFQLFGQGYAALFIDAPDEAQQGWVFNNGLFTPPIPVVVAPQPILVSPVEFMLLFTSPERVAIKAARLTDPIIDDFLDIIEDPRLTFVNLSLGSTLAALDYMIYTNLIAAERKAEIVTGVML